MVLCLSRAGKYDRAVFIGGADKQSVVYLGKVEPKERLLSSVKKSVLLTHYMKELRHREDLLTLNSS